VSGCKGPLHRAREQDWLAETMTQPQSVLAECLDLWLNGGDTAPVLDRHPDVAREVSSLLVTAQRVRDSAAGFNVTPDTARLRDRSNRIVDRRREAILSLLRRVLTIEVASH
jgi:hypothetical protein